MAQPLDRATLRAIAERALDEWDICAAQLELVSISENTVFRLNTDTGETYVLRIHRPGYHNLAELNSEQQWTAALKRAGIGVPLPRLTRDGHGYATVPVPGSTETRHVGIVEWFEGVTLSSLIAHKHPIWRLWRCISINLDTSPLEFIIRRSVGKFLKTSNATPSMQTDLWEIRPSGVHSGFYQN